MSAIREKTCRGYMIQSTANYIEKAYDPTTRTSVYERIHPRVRELLATVDKVNWYPIDDVAEIFRAIAAHHRETDGDLVKALQDVGRSIAETSANTSLRLLFRLMTPQLFATKAPDIWGRNDRCGLLTVPSYDPAKRQMRVSLTGVGGYDYVGAVVPGFILYSLEAVGCTSPKVTFDLSDKNPAPDSIVYEFAWT